MEGEDCNIDTFSKETACRRGHRQLRPLPEFSFRRQPQPSNQWTRVAHLAKHHRVRPAHLQPLQPPTSGGETATSRCHAQIRASPHVQPHAPHQLPKNARPLEASSAISRDAHLHSQARSGRPACPLKQQGAARPVAEAASTLAPCAARRRCTREPPCGPEHGRSRPRPPDRCPAPRRPPPHCHGATPSCTLRRARLHGIRHTSTRHHRAVHPPGRSGSHGLRKRKKGPIVAFLGGDAGFVGRSSGDGETKGREIGWRRAWSRVSPVPPGRAAVKREMGRRRWSGRRGRERSQRERWIERRAHKKPTKKPDKTGVGSRMKINRL